LPQDVSGRLKKVFIVGFPRSGTTWVMFSLAQHPEVVCFQQTGFFHALRPFESWWTQDHGFTSGANGKNPVYEVQGSSKVLSRENFFRFLRPLGEHLFQRLASQNEHCRVVVEQTPENSEFLDLVLGLFPDAYFLHVIRDPRAAYSSMRQASQTWGLGFPSTPLAVSKRWKDIVLPALELRRLQDRYLEITYEDFSRDGPAVLARIHRWIGLETQPEACQAALEACRIDHLRSKTKMPPNFYRKGSPDGWREEISRSELRVLEYLLGTEMEKLGYPRMLPHSDRKPWELRWGEFTARTYGRLRGVGRIFKGPRRMLQRWRSHLEILRTEP